MDKDGPRLIPRAEPFLFRGGKIGCVLIHGFTATPHVMLQMGEHLADKGFSALGMRLPGHATRPEDMEHIRWTDWLVTLEEGVSLLRKDCEAVFLVGHSMGGALSLLYSTYHPITGVAALATLADTPPDSRLSRLGFLTTQAQIQFLGWLSHFKGYQQKGEGYWHDESLAADYISYPVYPLRGVVELRKMLRMMRSRLHAVRCPLLLVHSTADQFISYQDSEWIHQAAGSQDKGLVLFERAGHILTMDSDKKRVFDEVVRFIQRVTQASRMATP